MRVAFMQNKTLTFNQWIASDWVSTQTMYIIWPKVCGQPSYVKHIDMQLKYRRPIPGRWSSWNTFWSHKLCFSVWPSDGRVWMWQTAREWYLVWWRRNKSSDFGLCPYFPVYKYSLDHYLLPIFWQQFQESPVPAWLCPWTKWGP